MPPKGMVQLGNVSVLERPSSPVALEDQRLAKKDKNDAVREDPLEVEVEGNQENTNSGTSKGFAGDISKNNSGKDTCLGDKVKSTYKGQIIGEMDGKDLNEENLDHDQSAQVILEDKVDMVMSRDNEFPQ
ncbi:hypothetical protein V6N13_082670 [Hibiscus sabdariffa]